MDKTKPPDISDPEDIGSRGQERAHWDMRSCFFAIFSTSSLMLQRIFTLRTLLQNPSVNAILPKRRR